jgi:tRNA dimethylallyltransferase
LDAEKRVAGAIAAAGEDPDSIVAIVGPTASGKTELALALAESIGGEILGVDSVQVYRFFDIGSGKPTPDELSRATHHLIGAIDPLESIDAARFASMARRAILDVRARGKRPILAGGTFLWTKAVLFGLAEAPPANAEIRARHFEIARERGRAALHETLRAADPASAARLHPNDVVRVSRALEVYELTGRSLSLWQGEHAFKTPLYDARLVATRISPADLTLRIERRVDAMLASGWIDEVRDLLARGYGEARAMGSVGYREVRAYLEGRIASSDLKTAIVRATRVFARRQRTWLNHEPVTWL